MARTGIRLSFKVLNSKNAKENWTYAPSSTASIVDASRKVVGVETTGQCVCKTWPENVEESDPSVKLIAYLPKADAGKSPSTDIQRCSPVLMSTDFSKIGGSNQYISVDGRPLSPDRGISKEIIKLYKSSLRSAAKTNGVSTLNDPFLNLHISCPPGAYDVNVEPAKDDVLFAEREQLIQTIEELFKSTYGELQKASESTEKASTSVKGFSVLLRQPAIQEPVSPLATNQLPAFTSQFITTPDRTKAAQRDLPTTEDDGLSQSESPGTASNDNGLNPWSIAKTHFFHRSPKSNKVSQFITPTRPGFRSSGGRNAAATQSSPPDIASPYSLSEPEDGHFPPRRSISSSTRCGRGSNGYNKASRERDQERYGNGSLDTWFVKNTGSTLSNTSSGEILDDDSETESVMLDDLDDEVIEKSSRIANKPFKLPLSNKSQDKRQRQLLPSPDTEPSNVQSEKRQEFPVMEEWSARLHQNFPDDQSVFSSQDTERALDFERRKKEVNTAHRKQLRQQYLASPASSQPTSKSPYKNRYLAARATLSEYSQQSQSGPPQKVHSTSNDESAMKENDPRTYFIRHKSELEARANDATKFKRIPTNRLPLEIIPKGFDVHDLEVKLDISLLQLTHHCKYFAEIDHYVSCSDDGATKCSPFDPVHEPDLADICKIWENSVAQLVKEKYRLLEVDLYDAAGGSDEASVEKIDIYGAIKSKSSN
jgi:DNA mismatch repair ATPase MutL